MNQDRIRELSKEVAEFVLLKVVGTGISPAEVAQALGEAIAVVAVKPFAERIRALQRLQQEPEEEEEEDEDEEFRASLSNDEKSYVWQRLSATYPQEIVRLIGTRQMKCPEWLQKEIIERRG